MEVRDCEEDDHGGENFCGIDLYVLPEGCMAAVISFTTPRDACRLASVSKIFKSAADSDSVWENFLPSDYPEILAQSDGGLALLNSLSRKQLFLHLADRALLIDGGFMSLSLEKSTGKKCYTIAARNLTIMWGSTPRYWTWHSVPESRFAEVAELLDVCWFEIRGKLKTSMLSPNTNYVAYFIFKMSDAAIGFHHFVEMVVRTTGEETKTRNVYMGPDEVENRRRQRRIRASSTSTGGELPKPRGDGWREVEIGEFFVRGDEEGEVEMFLLETKGGNWKQGLVVEGIEIRPKVVESPNSFLNQSNRGARAAPPPPPPPSIKNRSRSGHTL